MKVQLTKDGVFVRAGGILDVPRVNAERLIREKRAVPFSGRGEKMVPQRRTERMKSK